MDERTHVDTGWGMVHNEYVELNAGFEDDPGTSAYEQVRNVCHSRGLAMDRLNAVCVSIDCKPNIMDAQAKGKYRDKKGRPLPGPDGDLARSCDEQLADVFRAVKRIADERELLVGQRDRECEHKLNAAYGASTDDEEERHMAVELEQQSSDDGGDGRDEPAAPADRTTETEVTGHHGTEPGPQRIAPTSAVSGARESLMLETAVTAFSPSACTDEAIGGQTADGDEMSEAEPGLSRQREDDASRVTGWCNGDSVRADGSLTVVAAGTLSQMPHGRWKSSIATGMALGISHDRALTGDAGSEWTARTFRSDSGTSIGMPRFRLKAMVHDGTDEELVSRLTGMMPGARVERQTSNSGVTSHLVHSDRRVDTHAMLASVGLNVPNTNPMAHHPLQSFITHATIVATTPTHRDENNAILVQLRGSKEMLIHPPTLSLPGCPASVFADASATTNPR